MCRSAFFATVPDAVAYASTFGHVSDKQLESV